MRARVEWTPHADADIHQASDQQDEFHMTRSTSHTQPSSSSLHLRLQHSALTLTRTAGSGVRVVAAALALLMLAAGIGAAPASSASAQSAVTSTTVPLPTALAPQAAVVADDGSVTIVVSGNADPHIRVIHLHPDLTLDTSYGTQGVARLPGLATAKPANSPDGGVYLLARNDSSAQALFEHLLSNGTPDPAFGQNGQLALPVSLIGYDAQVSPLVTPTGQILVVGYDTSAQRAALVRVNPNGTVDPTFGNAGVADLPQQHDATAITLTTTAIFVATSGQLTKTDLNGNIDPTFGSAGTLRTISVRPRAIVLDDQGRIVLASGEGFLRYNSTGTLDPTYGAGACGAATPGSANGGTNPSAGFVLLPGGGGASGTDPV